MCNAAELRGLIVVRCRLVLDFRRLEIRVTKAVTLTDEERRTLGNGRAGDNGSEGATSSLNSGKQIPDNGQVDVPYKRSAYLLESVYITVTTPRRLV